MSASEKTQYLQEEFTRMGLNSNSKFTKEELFHFLDKKVK